MKRIGKLRTQVDRWPTSDLRGAPYVLTVICVGLYDKKPDAKTIVQALRDACDDVMGTEGVANAAPYMSDTHP